MSDSGWYEYRMLTSDGGINHVDVYGKDACISEGVKACEDWAKVIGPGKLRLEVSPKSNLSDVVYSKNY